jgi:S-adenosyl methyltransferase
VPNAARMYDYYLGGKDNYAVDRAAAEAVLAVAPEMREAARSGRAMIKRVVEHLVGDRGIRQLIDIGSGISAIYQRANAPFTPRAKDDIAAFFGDFDLEPPAWSTSGPTCRSPPGMDPELSRTGYGAVGRQP